MAKEESGSVDIVDSNREKIGEIPLNEALRKLRERSGLVHEAVVMQRASLRQGTAFTKTKGLVRGGGKKPWRQKGTGRARAGSSRSPLWKGGGTVFGPVPRSYAYSFPKKKMRQALISAWGSKIKEGDVVVLETLSLQEAKTKALVKFLQDLHLTGKILIVEDQENLALRRASQNIKNVKVLTLAQLSVYDLLDSEQILTTRPVIDRLNGSEV